MCSELSTRCRILRDRSLASNLLMSLSLPDSATADHLSRALKAAQLPSHRRAAMGGRRAGLELGQPVGDRDLDLIRQFRYLAQEAPELATRDHRDDHRSLGDHGRGPRPGAHQRDLTEVVAWSARRDHAIAVAHFDFAFE